MSSSESQPKKTQAGRQNKVPNGGAAMRPSLSPPGRKATNKPEALKIRGYKTLKLYPPDNGIKWV